jgi:hypothetical protein
VQVGKGAVVVPERLAGFGHGVADSVHVGRLGNASEVVPVWVGQAVDLITTIEPAQDLVATLAAEAESALARAYQCRTAGPE